MDASQASRMIGAPIKRKEDRRLLMGDGSYTGDVELRGMTYMAVVRSPYAHARIRHINASEALSHSEVLAVLTGPEAQQYCKSQFLLFGVKEGTRTKSRWPMATEVAKFEGEPVAAVLATSSRAARDFRLDMGGLVGFQIVRQRTFCRHRDEIQELLGQGVEPGLSFGRQGYALLPK